MSIEENDKLPVIQGTMARIITKLQNQTPATPTVFPKQHESNNINSNNQLTINIKTNKIVSFEDPIGTPESITAMLSIKDYDCENEPIKSIGDKLTQKTGLKTPAILN
ncbi:MAG: hypothetical protein HWD59_10295 [Coxiellaceae bacterium]|nr:MAG: hypothetical protein HWD59_10295 [Coxiellaceae bacterium]